MSAILVSHRIVANLGRIKARTQCAVPQGTVAIRRCSSKVNEMGLPAESKGDGGEKRLIWAPLHTHSDFSFLDGASRVPDLAKRAAEMGIPAVALTDHGNMHGAVLHMQSCSEHGVKPIVGNEMYLINGDISDPKYAGAVHHLTVMAKNLNGYRNLVKLTSISHLQGAQIRNRSKRPAINKELLTQHSDGLIVLSGCLAGEIPRALIAAWYRDVFGEDFYLELMDHGLDADKIVTPGIIRLSEELGIKTVITNDSHFTNKSDCTAHDALLCIQTGKKVSDEKRMRYTGTEYFKSANEMVSMFRGQLDNSQIELSLRNTLEVAAKVEKYSVLGAPKIPLFPVPAGYAGDEAAREGLALRFGGGSIPSSYQDRLEYELNLLVDKGFASYFLIVWDYIRFAREHNIAVGPGRGSACGSLAAYALQITNVDPVAHDLLFERFLNPERQSLPDIDTDFSVEGRERVIRYVTNKYGEDRVAQIVTFNRLSTRAVLRDCGRVLGVPYDTIDSLAKLVPMRTGKPVKLADLIAPDQTVSAEFKARYNESSSIKELVNIALILEGTNRNSGTHAAGIVIGAERLDDTVPLMRGKNNEVLTQYGMEDLEAVGLLKMDILGLKTLTVITGTEDQVRKRWSTSLPSLSDLDLQDEKTYDLLTSGSLDGIFQLDASGGMQQVVKVIGPTSVVDLSSILALYRPGPLGAGLVDSFVKRKHGTEEIQYQHEKLRAILKETYGVLVYQEQIMRVAREIAGYSLGEADILRRAMGKKKMDVMERERPRFVKGAAQSGMDEKSANDLFNQMLNFASYCFNKSHSVAYAHLTYHTAWLKANYPVEFIASLLRMNSDNMDKIPRFIEDAESLGVRVLAPNVNTSGVHFVPFDKSSFNTDRNAAEDAFIGYIGFGLSAVKGVSDIAAQALVEDREANGPYRSIFDFCHRIPSRLCGKRGVEQLIQCGAFDELHGNRKALMELVPDIVEWRRRRQDMDRRRKENKTAEDNNINSSLSEEYDAASVEHDARVLAIRQKWEDNWKPEDDYSHGEKYRLETELLGFYASGNLFKEYEQKFRFLAPEKLSNVEDRSTDEKQETVGIVEDDEASIDVPAQVEGPVTTKLQTGRKYLFAGVVTSPSVLVVRSTGKAMMKFTLEDASSACDCVAFSNVYPRLKDILQGGQVVVVQGRVSSRGNGAIHVEAAQLVDESKVALVYLTRDEYSQMKDWKLELETLAKSVYESQATTNPVPIRIAVLSDDQQSIAELSPRLDFVPRMEDPERFVHACSTQGLRAAVIDVAVMDGSEEEPRGSGTAVEAAEVATSSTPTLAGGSTMPKAAVQQCC